MVIGRLPFEVGSASHCPVNYALYAAGRILNGSAHPIHIGSLHTCVRWENQHALTDGVGDRKLSLAVVVERCIRLHAVATRVKVVAHHDLLLM
jgi:hypothetical protein